MTDATDPALRIPIDGLRLDAPLSRPAGATGSVIVAAPSASSRHDVRTRHLAEALQRAGLATLLVVGDAAEAW